jgi:ATP-dependent Lhr-like helicase
VDELDVKGRLVFVHAVGGKMEISWPGDYGEIHTKILKRMMRVLAEDTEYPYLKPNARVRLAETRALAAKTEMLNHPIVHLGGYSYALFPWVGTRQFRTLRKLLYSFKDRFKLSAIDYERCYYITFRMEKGTPDELYAALRERVTMLDGEELIELSAAGENPIFDKYDEYIPSELLRQAYAADRLEKKIEI